MDQTMIRELFGNVLKAAAVLGKKDSLLNEIEGKKRRLLGFQIGARGQLQEWDQDFAETEPEHRHLSNLYGFHPGNEISLRHNPELAAAVRRSLELRGDGGTGWVLAWKANHWARLREAGRAHELLIRQFTPESTRASLLSQFNNWYQIDGNIGGASAIIEMLVQDHTSVTGSVESDPDKIGIPILDILPALPEPWSEGRIEGLRCRGGFVIESLAWKAGKLEEIQIRSEQGRSCVVSHNGTDRLIQMGKEEKWQAFGGELLTKVPGSRPDFSGGTVTDHLEREKETRGLN